MPKFTKHRWAFLLITVFLISSGSSCPGCPKEDHSIMATAGTGGSISPSGTVKVKDGNSQTFTITADTGYSVADVKVDGTSVGAVTTYTFTNVTADHSIEATFLGDTPDVDVSGLWVGNVTMNWSDGSSSSNTPMVMSLSQSGTTITGINAGTDGNLNITGSVSGNIFSMTMTLPCSGGNTTIILTHTVSGSSMTATSGSGEACPGNGIVNISGYSGSLSKSTSTQASTYSTITIDGNFIDWNSLGVLFNSQIGSFKLAQDKNNLYVLFDINNAISNSTYYQVSLYKDANRTDGYDLRIFNNTAVINRLVNHSSSGFIADGIVSTGTNKIEASFPMSAMGFTNASTVWLRPHIYYNNTQTNIGDYTQVILW